MDVYKLLNSFCILFVLSCVSPLQAAIDDPVAYWSFSDSENLLVNGAVPGPYHNATVLNGLPISGIFSGASGIVGNSMVLNGSSAIRVPYHQDRLGSSFTIAMWYWQDNADTRMALYQTEDNWDISYEAAWDDNSAFQNFIGTAEAGRITTKTNEWIHLAHVFSTVGDTTTLSAYTNGVLALTKSVTSNQMFNTYQIRSLNVGCNRDVGRFFEGMIDELALWNRALSGSEVSDLYQRGNGGSTLSVTQQRWPRVNLEGLTYTLNADAASNEGVYQDGWLKDGIQKLPLPPAVTLADTAARQDDSAGHADGPFHAESLGPKFRIVLTNALKEITQGDFTVETRFRTTDAARNVVMGNYAPGVAALNIETYFSNQVRFYLQTAGASPAKLDTKFSAGSITVADGNWHHLVALRRGGEIFMYLDGNEVGSVIDTIGSMDLTGDYFYLKGDSRDGEPVMIGDTEMARFWSRALSTNEVAGLSAGKLPGDSGVGSTNMVAEYKWMLSPYNAASSNPKYKVPIKGPFAELTQTNFTLETFFRTTDAARGILLGNYANDGNIGILNLELYIDNKVRIYHHMKTNNLPIVNFFSASVPYNIYDGNWHHVAGVRRGSTYYLHVDGKQISKLSATVLPEDLPNNNFYICRDIRTGSTEFDGELKNARFWSRALSSNEIAEVSSGELPGGDDVSIDGMIAEYSYIYPTNDLVAAGYQGNSFLRTYCDRENRLSLVFENLPSHTDIGISGLLAQIDSLDVSADSFSILVDGAEVFKVKLGDGREGNSAVDSLILFGETADVQLLEDCLTLGGEELFLCARNTGDFNDHVYDLSLLEEVQAIPHTSDTLLVELIGVQDAEGQFESFGIDDFTVTFVPPEGTIIMVQ